MFRIEQTLTAEATESLAQAFLPFLAFLLFGATVRILRIALFKLRRLRGRPLVSGLYALGLAALAVSPFGIGIWIANQLAKH